MMSERFDLFMRNNRWYWKASGEVHGTYPTRAEAQDAAIEHVLAKARSEHAARLAALYHALDADRAPLSIPETVDSI